MYMEWSRRCKSQIRRGKPSHGCFQCFGNCWHFITNSQTLYTPRSPQTPTHMEHELRKENKMVVLPWKFTFWKLYCFVPASKESLPGTSCYDNINVMKHVREGGSSQGHPACLSGTIVASIWTSLECSWLFFLFFTLLDPMWSMGQKTSSCQCSAPWSLREWLKVLENSPLLCFV